MSMPMTRVGRARERGETQGFMKVLVERESSGSSARRCCASRATRRPHAARRDGRGQPYTSIQRAVHIHPTVSELLPTLLGQSSRSHTTWQHTHERRTATPKALAPPRGDEAVGATCPAAWRSADALAPADARGGATRQPAGREGKMTRCWSLRRSVSQRWASRSSAAAPALSLPSTSWSGPPSDEVLRGF